MDINYVKLTNIDEMYNSRYKSGRWDSNPRRSPWEGDILPLNYTRNIGLSYHTTRSIHHRSCEWIDL